MTLPADIAAVIQELDADTIVHMYELDATQLGGEVYRFTSSTKETEPISFGGFVYAPVPVETQGWEVSARGTVPRPIVRVANANNIMSQIVNEFGDLVNCPFRRIRTFKMFLDGEPTANPDAHFPIDIYRIEQKSNQNRLFIEWTLAAGFDQQGKMLPGRQVIQRTCTHRYRRWDPVAGEFDYSKATCPYTGSKYFDATGAVTTPDKDRCSKMLRSGCIKRFGKGELPTRAFPGVGRSSVGS